MLQTAQLEERKWKQELQRFLLSYRVTLHAATKIAPCELLFNRTVKGHLPELPSKKILNWHKEAKENIETSQERNKEDYDKIHHTKESIIKEGDIVICLQKKRNKLTPKFSPERFTVISRKGTRLVAKNKYHYHKKCITFQESEPL